MILNTEKLPRSKPAAGQRWLLLWRAVLGWAVVAPLFTGCASFTNPVAQGIPARMLPPEFLAEPRDPKRTIPLAWLRRAPVKEYRLAAGDILGVFVDGVLGDSNSLPPVTIPESGGLPPAVGVPIAVREDGSLPLPRVEPVNVKGMTVTEAEKAVIHAYTVSRKLVRMDKERIMVSLIRPRTERILVIRQDNPGDDIGQANPLGRGGFRGLNSLATTATTQHTGTGTVVDLPAYENDILNALTRTGGLPGAGALNEVVIQRGGFRPDTGVRDVTAEPSQMIRIPMRMTPGEKPPFKPEDVILKTGDIVFVEARLAEVYYTAGLLPAREIPLPRDVDINVVEAIARSGGPLVNGGLNSSNLSGQIVAHGIGNPSPSLLAIIRSLPDGRKVTIRVDLYRALTDERENLVIQASDVLVLQETPGEAFARFTTNILTLNFVADLFTRASGSGTATATLPLN